MFILNGQAHAAADPAALLLNRSFRFGDGLFETIRVYAGRLLFVQAHLDRLVAGMDTLGYTYAPDWRVRIAGELRRILHLNQIDQHGRVRLHVYRAGPGAYAPVEHDACYLVEAFALKSDYFQSPPIQLTVYEQAGVMPSVFSAFKTASALPYVMAARYAQQQGCDDALLMHDRHPAEASSSNLFYVHQRQLYTPSLDTGCLAGIMRAQVIQLAGRLQIPVHEKKFRLRDLRQADEVFLTNTVRGIQPVSTLQATTYMAPGPLTAFLRQCMHQMINEST
ncbi:MAG: aminodeoxychorismate lyase [Bacteroidia bacterium]